MKQQTQNQILILVLFAMTATTSFGQSRKIREEDLSQTPMPTVAVNPATGTVASTGVSSLIASPGVNYIPHDQIPVSTNQIAYPTPPSPDASLPVMQAAIQAFMQFMQQPSTQKDAATKYPDYVNPTAVNRQSTAPSVDPRPLKDCGGLSPAAKEKMKAYLSRCGANLRIPNGNVSIIDFSSSRPVMYVLRQSDLSCVTAMHVGYGVNSHGNPPKAGNSPSSLMTPPGFHITKVHNGAAYQEFNSIGIAGMGSDNSNTIGRGVILHPSNGHTHGCIGIPWAQFAEVKKMLGYGTVVYNYFPNQANGDSEMRCPSYKRTSYRSTQGFADRRAAPSADDEAGVQ